MTADPQRYAGLSATKAMRVLSLVGSQPAQRWTVAELRAAIGWPAATLRRHLAVLVAAQYLHHNPDGRYSLGAEVWLLQNEPEFLDLLVNAAAEPLTALRDETGETAVLSVLSGVDAVCLAQVTSHQPLLAQAPFGDRFAAHTWAQGRANLATLTRMDRLRFLPRDHSADLDAFHDQLDRAREGGYAVDRDEVAPGVAGMAVAVPNVIRLAAIGIVAPTVRLPPAREADLGHRLTAAAVATAGQIAAGRAARVAAFNSQSASAGSAAASAQLDPVDCRGGEPGLDGHSVADRGWGRVGR